MDWEDRRPHYSLDEVFVTNGSPGVTFVRRDDEVEGRLASSLAARQKIIAVSGPSKAGKTVLVRRVVTESLGWELLDVSGNDLSSIDDFWLILAARLGVASSVDVTSTSGMDVRAGAIVEAGLPGVVKAQARVDSGMSHSNGTTAGATVDIRLAVRERLSHTDAVVVIDDFHYAPESVRRDLARTLKDLSARRVPAVLIAVPHRVLDLVASEPELMGRVFRTRVEHWSPMELVRIPMLGLRAMNVTDPEGRISERLVAQSFGSPLLTQELTGRICRLNDVLETQEQPYVLEEPGSWRDFFADAARDVEHPLAQAFHAGPQERKRRKQRELVAVEGEVDTYGAVLLGLRDCLLMTRINGLPATSISLTELTDAVNMNLIQRLELRDVRRVCLLMRKRAEEYRHGDDASLDVSETSPARLTVVDPYLAYYISWGLDSLGLPRSRA